MPGLVEGGSLDSASGPDLVRSRLGAGPEGAAGEGLRLAWPGRTDPLGRGQTDAEERDLGFRFPGGQHGGRPRDTNATAEVFPDEAGLLELASLWSIDPTTLDGHFKEPEPGLLGLLPG